MTKRKRNKQLLIWVTEEEKALLHQNMRMQHMENMGAYIRMMSIYQGKAFDDKKAR